MTPKRHLTASQLFRPQIDNLFQIEIPLAGNVEFLCLQSCIIMEYYKENPRKRIAH